MAQLILSASIRRSVRGGLGGVWLRGPLPGRAGERGAVLAATHQSWWDGYVLRELTLECGHEYRVLMGGRQLARFPFLRRVGALPVGAGGLRAAVRAARAGAWVTVFPAGTLQACGVGPVHPGAGWVAAQAGVPLVPLALRVVLRGGQHPEAYLRAGAAVSAPELEPALRAQLAALEAELAGGDPEAPLAGYLRVVAGRRAQHERLDWPSRLLARLTGER